MIEQKMKKMSPWFLLTTVFSGAALLVLLLMKTSGLVISPVLAWPLIAVFFLSLAAYLIPRVESPDSSRRENHERPHLRAVK